MGSVWKGGKARVGRMEGAAVVVVMVGRIAVTSRHLVSKTETKINVITFQGGPHLTRAFFFMFQGGGGRCGASRDKGPTLRLHRGRREGLA